MIKGLFLIILIILLYKCINNEQEDFSAKGNPPSEKQNLQQKQPEKINNISDEDSSNQKVCNAYKREEDKQSCYKEFADLKEKQSKKDKTNKMFLSAKLQVSADTLMSDYEDNELAADSKYKGQVILITGEVNLIGKDILGTPYITFNSGESVFAVQCMFDNSYEGKLAELHKGQKITIEGRVSSKLGNVILRECSF